MKIGHKALYKDLIKKINRITAYSKSNSLYYKKLFRGINFPGKVASLDEFESIPITFRKDLAERNEEFIAVPKDMWADIVTTTGTSGRPIFFPFTKRDVINNSYFIAKKFSVFGLRKDDVAYITAPVERSMWIGGLSVWLGCLKIGACSLRAGNVGADKHLEFIKRFNPTIIFGLPSFILRLGEELRSRISRRTYKPRLIVTFGENIMQKDLSRNILGKSVEKIWGAKIISGYGSTEASPGFECIFQSGHHILPEMVYVEIVDPDTLKVLGPGKEGLVVITHFGREGLPLIRYANGDISFLVTRKCKCGRVAPRLGPILGRIDEKIKVKGVNILPNELEGFVLNTPFIRHYLIELFTDRNLCDNIKLYISFKGKLSGAEKMNKMNYLRDKLRETFGIRIATEEIAGHRALEKTNIKERRIIDKRAKR
ncbi:MAG: AMP-binding protein [Candidatus Omnitrophica bacterium]|nr:AMP-binding protein [Candidatus Omnitrophota bacterium]MDD5552832.1 AMP-binding protein [Candidatus Omnitrophota bacterium]